MASEVRPDALNLVVAALGGGTHRSVAGVDTCGETTTVTKGGDVPQREEEREEAQENEDFTVNALACSAAAGKGRGRRN
jgi:hypothetical protein